MINLQFQKIKKLRIKPKLMVAPRGIEPLTPP